MEFAAGALEAAAGGATANTAAGFTGITTNVAFAGAPLASAPTGTLLSALGQTSTWSSILQGGATVASVLAAQRAGDERAFSLELNAQDAETNAQIEGIQGLDRRSTIKDAFVQAMGERDVATAASGIDLSFGTPVAARREAAKDTERALATDQETENLRKARLLERASSYRIMAGQARQGSLAKAAGIGLEGAASILRRG